MPLSCEAIANFLAIAMGHFKDLRDNHKILTVLEDSWGDSVVDGRLIVGGGRLKSQNGSLPINAWCRAVITAYSSAETLSQIKEQLAEYKAHADGWLAEVIVALEKKMVMHWLLTS